VRGTAVAPSGGRKSTDVTGRRRDHRNRILVALMLTMALVAMDTTIVATAIPQVVGDLGGFSLVGWVFSVYLLAQTVTIPVYGKLADLYGRKPVLVIGVVVFLVGSALSASSWNMLTLICFRALQGLGAGSIGATVNTVAGDLYDVAERGRIQGWLSSVWGVSAVVAPALGGVFAEYASWRWIFLVNLPIGAIALSLILRELHEQVQRRRHRIDYAGAAGTLLATGLLILGLLQGGTAWAWDSAASFAVFGCALLAGIATVLIERRAAEPMMSPELWGKRVNAGSYAATIVAGMLVIGLSTFLPTWAQSVLGLDAVEAGLMLGVMSLAWPTASALSSRLYLRIGFRDTALIGAVFAIASGVVFSTTAAHSPVIQPVCGSALMGVALGLITTSLIVGQQSTVGWGQRGAITGGAMFSRFFGQSVGAAVYGAVTNTIVLHHLRSAPAALRDRVPGNVNGVETVLGRHPPGPVASYLRDALQASTHGVFLGLLAAAGLTAVLLLFVPRRFPTIAHDSAAAGATGAASDPVAGERP
jgi:multidrug resistance protein